MDAHKLWMLRDFIGTNKVLFRIPVYQRNYDWSEANCDRLLDDIYEIINSGDKHFLGTIVFMAAKSGGFTLQEYTIIDGQQRLTTMMLILKALAVVAETGGDTCFQEIDEQYLHNKYCDEKYKVKLKPIKSDNNQFLDSRLVITPNIDKIYEQYAMNASDSSIVVKSYHEYDIAKYLRTTDYLIIRAHGYVDDTTNIIFTHKQYSVARCKYSSFYKLLDALILTHTFIFLGCGINDPDIKLTLENSNFLYPGCRPHYFVTAAGSYEDEISEVLSNNRNL